MDKLISPPFYDKPIAMALTFMLPHLNSLLTCPRTWKKNDRFECESIKCKKFPGDLWQIPSQENLSRDSCATCLWSILFPFSLSGEYEDAKWIHDDLMTDDCPTIDAFTSRRQLCLRNVDPVRGRVDLCKYQESLLLLSGHCNFKMLTRKRHARWYPNEDEPAPRFACWLQEAV